MDMETLLFNLNYIEKRIEVEKENLEGLRYLMKLRAYVDMDNGFIANIWEVIRGEYILKKLLLQTLYIAYKEMLLQLRDS